MSVWLIKQDKFCIGYVNTEDMAKMIVEKYNNQKCPDVTDEFKDKFEKWLDKLYLVMIDNDPFFKDKSLESKEVKTYIKNKRNQFMKGYDPIMMDQYEKYLDLKNFGELSYKKLNYFQE